MSDEIERGKKAISALKMLSKVRDLGDFIYDIREREGKGWDGPKVKVWSDACELVKEVVGK